MLRLRGEEPVALLREDVEKDLGGVRDLRTVGLVDPLDLPQVLGDSQGELLLVLRGGVRLVQHLPE